MTVCNWEGGWFVWVREIEKGLTAVSKESWALFLTITFKARISLFILQNCKSGTRTNLFQSNCQCPKSKSGLSYSKTKNCSCGSPCFCLRSWFCLRFQSPLTQLTGDPFLELEEGGCYYLFILIKVSLRYNLHTVSYSSPKWWVFKTVSTCIIPIPINI